MDKRKVWHIIAITGGILFIGILLWYFIKGKKGSLQVQPYNPPAPNPKIKNKGSNCPNCGAGYANSGGACLYCGTDVYSK